MDAGRGYELGYSAWLACGNGFHGDPTALLGFFGDKREKRGLAGASCSREDCREVGGVAWLI